MPVVGTPASGQSVERVDFIVAGAQKGGTSALDVYLRQHPELCMALRKEVHWFDDEERFAGGTPPVDGYHRFFAPQPGQRLVGEATPIYMYWRDAPRRMWEYNPELRLLVCLRNPIQRAHSHWNMEHQRGDDPLPFAQALQQEEARLRSALPWQHRVFSYVDRGFYLEQLRRLWAFFPREQVLVLRSDELRRQRADCLRRVCRFLNIGMIPDPEADGIHSRSYEAPMARSEWAWLRDAYEPEIRGLERALGWDLSAWLEPPPDLAP